MFKELKVIKLIVIVGLLLAILTKIDFTSLSIYQLYTDKTSYSLNDEVTVYTSSKAMYPIFKKSNVSTIFGEKISDLELDLNHSTIKKGDILLNGENLGKSISFELDKNIFSTGIYLVANDYPLIISSNKPSDITIVYPYMNNLIYQKVEEQSVFPLNLYKTSTKRSVKVDDYTLGLTPVFENLNKNYSINYINDLDLENKQKIASTKLLMIYGKSTFWTLKMKNNLIEFINSGGCVLFISSYLMNNVCWYNPESSAVTLYDEKRASTIESWHGYNGNAPRYVIGSSYLYGGGTDELNYKITDLEHPIFKSISDVKLKSQLYNSPPVNWEKNIPIIDTNVVKFYYTKILAYNKSTTSSGYMGVKAIFEFQPDSTSGKIINLGSEDWCLNSMGNNEKLILNSINYLLNK